jgi:hypothetical protein
MPMFPAAQCRGRHASTLRQLSDGQALLGPDSQPSPSFCNLQRLVLIYSLSLGRWDSRSSPGVSGRLTAPGHLVVLPPEPARPGKRRKPMIEKRHEAGLKPEHAYIAGSAGIGLSFLAWTASEGGRGRDRPGGPAGDLHRPMEACVIRLGQGATQLGKAVPPGRAAAGITASRRLAGPQASKRVGNRTQQDGSGVTAVKRMTAVAVMAGLLTSPVAAPNQPPGRPRRGLWHVVSGWLGYRRQVRRGSGGTNRR